MSVHAGRLQACIQAGTPAGSAATCMHSVAPTATQHDVPVNILKAGLRQHLQAGRRGQHSGHGCGDSFRGISCNCRRAAPCILELPGKQG